MSTYKFISYLLCNKGIIVNLYKLYFPSFPFSLKPNKRVFHSLTFPPLQPNIQEEKLNIFYPPTFPSSHNFSFSHFSILPTKKTLIQNKMSNRFKLAFLRSCSSLVIEISKNHCHFFFLG